MKFRSLSHVGAFILGLITAQLPHLFSEPSAEPLAPCQFPRASTELAEVDVEIPAEASQLTRRPASRSLRPSRNDIEKTTRKWKFFREHEHQFTPLKGLRILDVGMGQGPLCVVAIGVGVRHYTGLDPAVNVSEHARTRRKGVWKDGLPVYEPFPFTGQEMMDAYPGKFRLLAGTFETLQGHPDMKTGSFDVATLFSVTEHLPNNPLVLKGVFEILLPGQVLRFSHHNYYGYSGHHLHPKSPEKFDKSDANHSLVASWRHLEPESPPFTLSSLNRVRLGDLLAVVDIYFECAWIARVVGRNALTPALQGRLEGRGFVREELLIDRLNAACKRREEALPAPWLPEVQAHHPPADGSYTPRPLAPALRKVLKQDVASHSPAGLKKLQGYM